MNNYLIAYYKGGEPTFVYSESVDMARLTAIGLVNSRKIDKSDVLSIIDIETDRLVFDAKGARILPKLSGVQRPSLAQQIMQSHYFNALLNRAGLKTIRPTV